VASPALDHAAVLAFLRERFLDADECTELEHGEWSNAYAFVAEGLDLVVRFGHHRDDYEKDRVAASFASDALPIPGVFEIGDAFDGVYSFAPRAFGGRVEALGSDEFRRALPSLFAALDALREIEPPGKGFGWWTPDGEAHHSSWREFLLDVRTEYPRTAGWRERLASRPAAQARFDEGYAALERLSDGLPAVRRVVHQDLMAGNVLVEEERVSAVLDWGNSLYGDFLYDLAHLAFWLPWFPEKADLDVVTAARAHYESVGLEVPAFEQRLRASMVHIGLDAQTYNAFTDRWDELERSALRTLEVAAG
jgi:hygromycin-B 4-O-kinase